MSARGSRPSPRTSDEAVSRGNSRRSLDGGATCRKTAISRSALDKNAMPRHLFEDSVDEGTTRRGTDTPVHRPEKTAGYSYSSTSACHPVNNSRGKRGSLPQTRRGMTLQSQLCRDPEVGAEMERKPEVPASPRGEALFRCARPSGVPRGPANSTGSLASQRHPGKFSKVPGRRRGKRGFPAATRERPRESFFNAS